MSDGAVDARQDAQARVFDRALDTIATVPAALTELGGKIDASRQASAEAHATAGAKLDKFADVISANTNAMTATATANTALATELQAIRERNAAVAAEVQNANAIAAANKARAGASLWAAVDKWLPRIIALLAAGYATYKGVEPTPPAPAAPQVQTDGTP